MGDDSERANIVIDLGGAVSRIGFAGAEEPQKIIASCFQRENEPMEVDGAPSSHSRASAAYGNDAVTWALRHNKDPQTELVWPLDRGMARLGLPKSSPTHGSSDSWNDVEKLFRCLYEREMKLRFEDQGVLIAEPAYCPKNVREYLTARMFDEFSVPALYLAMQPVLALYASGRVSGLVVDMGHSHLSATPVVEGCALPNATRSCSFGGKDLNNLTAKLIASRSDNAARISLNPDVVRVHAALLKESLCRVARDCEVVAAGVVPGDRPLSYTLPDGSSLFIGEERLCVGEAMFNPSEMMGLQEDGIALRAWESLLQLEMDSRRECCSNVILVGGSSLMEGVTERMQSELGGLSHVSMKVKVAAQSNRQHQVWIGGSIQASLAAFNPQWIQKEEYEETGPAIVHRKCY